MKKLYPFYLILTAVVLVSCGINFSDSKNELKPSNTFNHIKYIRKKSEEKPWHENKDKSYSKYFVDYTIKNLLENPKHKKYITDRSLLRKLSNNVCWDNYISIKDTLSNGDKCVIEIKSQAFRPNEHKLKYEKETNYLIEVDSKYPYGAIYSEYPEEELKLLSIKINNKELNTQIEKYQNLFNPNFCNFGSNIRITEAYEDGNNLYIYMFGGQAADSYFAKLVFDKDSGFITSIIADYVPLSIYGSFGNDFIGY